jgi:predicted nucleotide-binding protein
MASTADGLEPRHEDALRRILQAETALRGLSGGDDEFTLYYSGEGPEILHGGWDRSWAVPSTQIVDDLGELRLVRIGSADGKGRSFSLSIGGRRKAEELVERLSEPAVTGRSAAEVELEDSVAKKIFVVHGHQRRDEIARFIRRVTGIDPIVLDEQAGRGRTIIEKFEEEARPAAYAVVLLTEDDLGKGKNEDQLEPRARQNAILELGYFIGRIGRQNVAVLHEEKVDILSDYTGVEYISFSDNWQTKLMRELSAAGIRIDPAGI